MSLPHGILPNCEAFPGVAATMFEIETFPNPAPHRSFTIKHICPEFTSVCPKTGQPDFATIDLEYIPDQTCIELKSLKFYYQGFRQQGIFYEAVVNRILDDLSAACSPRWMRVTGSFNVRGGIASVIVAEHGSITR
jgi:7-cyano-7-deazaguanine reductase